MFVLGLTGSIGMGKSATARMFARRGLPVFDADAEVHRLYAGDAVGPVEAAFPGVAVEGRVDRARLSANVVGDRDAIARLEAIVHPLVRAGERAMMLRALEAGARLFVREIPLLLETGGDRLCDAVAVVSAPGDIQRDRVLRRGDMTQAKFEAILARQMPDAEKRLRAHFVLDTSRDLDVAQKQVDDILRALAGCEGAAYARFLAQS